MNPLNQKLKTYRSINKGIIKPIKLSPNTSLKLAASIPMLLITSYPTLSAQCTMSIANNVQLVKNQGVGNGFQFDVNGADGPGNDFSLFNAAAMNSNKLNILNPNLQILRGNVPSSTDNFASVLRVTGNTTTGNFITIGNNDPSINYMLDGSSGQFTNGTSGNVVFKDGAGNVGFFTLSYTYTNPNIHRITITQGGLDTDGGTIIPGNCSSITLPVELVEFTTKENEGKVHLKWTTASEMNNAGFELQRSEDKQNFRTIQFIEGKGTTQITQEYGYQDADVRQGKLYYYRLKQIDFDGKFEYSKIAAIQLEGRNTKIGELYPNPSSNRMVQFDMNTLEEKNWNISLFTQTGTLILTEQRTITKGFSNQQLTTIDYPAGIYFLKIENEGERVYRKLIITE